MTSCTLGVKRITRGKQTSGNQKPRGPVVQPAYGFAFSTRHIYDRKAWLTGAAQNFWQLRLSLFQEYKTSIQSLYREINYNAGSLYTAAVVSGLICSWTMRTPIVIYFLPLSVCVCMRAFHTGKELHPASHLHRPKSQHISDQLSSSSDYTLSGHGTFKLLISSF
jgi:hypothetical protein